MDKLTASSQSPFPSSRFRTTWIWRGHSLVILNDLGDQLLTRGSIKLRKDKQGNLTTLFMTLRHDEIEIFIGMSGDKS
jgi:hypothetical protein